MKFTGGEAGSWVVGIAIPSGREGEAATRSKGVATFDNSVAGVLGIVVTESDKPFWRSGRLMDIPLTAVVEVPATSLSFTLTIQEIFGDNDLPPLLEIDGVLTVTSSP